MSPCVGFVGLVIYQRKHVKEKSSFCKRKHVKEYYHDFINLEIYRLSIGFSEVLMTVGCVHVFLEVIVCLYCHSKKGATELASSKKKIKVPK